MGLTSLLPTGLVRHLPAPPIEGFHSDQINLSDTAFQFGTPDGTLGVASFAANLPLAAFGGAERAAEQPWVPLAAMGKAAVDVVVSGWYLYQMPAKEKAWGPYCITAALASLGILALTLPEAWRAATAPTEPIGPGGERLLTEAAAGTGYPPREADRGGAPERAAAVDCSDRSRGRP